MISTLRRKPCQPALLKMRDSRGCTSSGTNSVPPCQSILLSKIHPSLALRSSKSTTTAFSTPSTPSAGWINLRNNQFLRHGGQLQLPTSWMVCPTPENQLTLKHTPGLTSASRGNSRPMGSKTPLSDKKSPPHWELCTPSLPRQLPPLTPEPTILPT